MEQRAELVALLEHGQLSVAAVCALFHVSRKTAHKWRGRYARDGLAGLADRARAPRTHPNATPAAMCAAVVALRREQHRFGPKQLRRVLRDRDPGATLPAVSTIGAILRRAGLTARRARAVAHASPGGPLGSCEAPNATWAADFKGEFRLGDRTLCYPLTITDLFSRYLLRAQALRSPDTLSTRAGFEAAFREYGLPATIRTDGGHPFAGHGAAGLSQLAVWWIKLGIRPERIRRPQQNGRHERMHRTLKAYVARPPRHSRAAQQRALDAFQTHFNTERPHEALDQQTPAALYHPSVRAYPRVVAPPEYPGHFERRQVRTRGDIKWRTHQIFVSHPLAGEVVGLEEIDEGVWRMLFGPVLLGYVLDAEPQLGLLHPHGQHRKLVLPMCPV